MSRQHISHFRLLTLTSLSLPLLAWACGGDPDVDGKGGKGGNASATGGSNGGISLGGGSGDGDGDGSGASTGTGSTGSGDSCAESNADADLVPANLLFVVDKSGSMNCDADGSNCDTPTTSSKWTITQKALTGSQGALQTLAGQAGISVGLITFPTNDYCALPAEGDLAVSLAPLSQDQLDSLTTGLSITAEGQTPLIGATIRGLQALDAGLEAGDLPGNNYLVVMTDGEETCQPGQVDTMLAYLETARTELGIRTYVIGAPGSEGARALLSQMAVAGGTAQSDTCKKTPTTSAESCHIDLTDSNDFEADLGSEFKGITEATTQTCEYDVPQNALIDANKVNVEYTPTGGKKELILRDPRQDGMAVCEGAEGWQFSEDGSKIILCGQVCDDVLADPGAKVNVVFGCRDTEIVIR